MGLAGLLKAAGAPAARSLFPGRVVGTVGCCLGGNYISIFGHLNLSDERTAPVKNPRKHPKPSLTRVGPEKQEIPVWERSKP